MNNLKKGPARSACSTAVAGGFTLIELLVVVAIIGVLASVVLVVLGGARGKGVDAAIKSNLDLTHVQAELFYDISSNGYEAVCAVASTNGISSFVIAAQKVYNGSSIIKGDADASLWNTGACHDGANAWAAIVPLKGSTIASPLAWCVDSSGMSKQVASTLLDWTFVCP